FGWGPREVGLSLAAFGVCIFIAEGLVLRWLLTKVTEHVVIISSTLLALVVLGTIGLTNREWLIWALLMPSAFSGFANSAIQGLASNRVGDDQQGELAGAVTSGVAIVSFTAPVVMTLTFATFTDRANDLPYLPGAAFLLAAIVCVIMFLPYGMARRRMNAES
ncbi:MAG: MFS transporter, partial [Pseudomonadota bacterium]